MSLTCSALSKAIILVALLLSTQVTRAEQVPTASPPQQRTLTIGVKDAPPFAMKAADGVWQGISIDLWRKVARELGLRYEFVEVPTVQELIKDTSSGRFDVAVAALTVTADRERIVDFTQSYYVTGLGIAVPTAWQPSWLPIFRTLTSFGFLQAVLALIALTLATGLFVWLFERGKNESFTGVKTGLTSSVWWSTLAMTQRSPTNVGPTTIGGRMIAIVWMVASIITLAMFTASITSALTTRQLQGNVISLRDLSTVQVGSIPKTAAAETLGRLSIDNTTYDNIHNGLLAVREGSLDAFVYDKPILAWQLRQHPSLRVRLLDLSFDEQTYAFALSPGNPLRKPLSVAMLESIKSDWWSQTKQRYLGRDQYSENTRILD
jgi:polar amino acid transport system substrate-binding protein